MNDQEHQKQIELARNLLKTVRHAAYATVNEDRTPHNTILQFICDNDLTRLYVSSHSESLHIKNLVRTGKTFAVLYDSFTKGQGGVYITGVNAHECKGEELVEALRVHNIVRTRKGSAPIDVSYYQSVGPSQRMYSIEIAKIEVHSAIRNEAGLIANEPRVPVDQKVLVEGLWA